MTITNVEPILKSLTSQISKINEGIDTIKINVNHGYSNNKGILRRLKVIAEHTNRMDSINEKNQLIVQITEVYNLLHKNKHNIINESMYKLLKNTIQGNFGIAYVTIQKDSQLLEELENTMNISKKELKQLKSITTNLEAFNKKLKHESEEIVKIIKTNTITSSIKKVIVLLHFYQATEHKIISETTHVARENIHHIKKIIIHLKWIYEKLISSNNAILLCTEHTYEKIIDLVDNINDTKSNFQSVEKNIKKIA